MIHGNTFKNIPSDLTNEVFETLVQSSHCKIKRIISLGQVTPKNEYYEQNEDEFVIVLQGAATLLFLDTQKTMEMKSGDYVFIPAGVKHRVQWCDTKVQTIWLAIYISSTNVE